MASELGTGQPGQIQSPRVANRQLEGMGRKAAASNRLVAGVPIPCPMTVGTALALAALDVFSWTSHGPPYRYVLATIWLVVAFAVDGAIHGSNRCLRPVVVLAMCLFGFWMLGIFVFAVMTRNWSSDSLVLFAGVLPLLAAPAAYVALPSRPQWAFAAQRICRGSVAVFSIAALLDAALTPHGEQPELLGHEKAFLAIVVLALPRFRGSWFVKWVVGLAVVVAFLKYPSATVGFGAMVAIVCFMLVQARTRTSLYVRGSMLVTCFLVIAINASDWLARFYLVVGRGDNTSTRIGLWDQALNTVRGSPLVGSAASEPITGLANIRGLIQPVPFHNSFLTLAACCGIIAVALFALLVLCLSSAILSFDPDVRRGTGLWLPALLAGAVTMSVNPVLDELGTALPFYGLVLCGASSVLSTQRGSQNG